MLRPQDILLLMKYQTIWHNDRLQCLLGDAGIRRKGAENGCGYTQRELAKALNLSVSEINNGKKRLIESRLILSAGDTPEHNALFQFLIHGLKYVFPAKLGTISRGMPTGYAAEPLKEHFAEDTEEGLVPVWPYAEGLVRGHAFEPIYKSAPFASKQDPLLYQYLVLIDAIRGGRAREQAIAKSILLHWILNEEYNYDAKS